MEQKKSVFIGIPTHDGFVHTGVMECILNMVQDNPNGYRLRLDTCLGKPAEHTRSILVHRFLETNCDYMLMIDTDNPPRKNPLPLVDEDKDVLALPTPIFYYEFADGTGKRTVQINIYSDSLDGNWHERPYGTGLEEIHAAGTGCMLIRRNVLEKVKPAFARNWLPDGRCSQGSDLLFCRAAREAGFKVWVAWDHMCSHYKTVDLAEVFAMMEARDVRAINLPNPNTPEYWNKKWKAFRDEPIPIPYMEWVVDQVKELASKSEKREFRVLDYGCGRGDVMVELSKIDKVKTLGVDWSEEAIDQCKIQGLDAQVTSNGDMPDGQFDLVVCTEVLQTVDDDRDLIAKLFEKSDLLLYTVPNDCFPPGLCPENRRVYWSPYIGEITPNVIGATKCGTSAGVLARK